MAWSYSSTVIISGPNRRRGCSRRPRSTRCARQTRSRRWVQLSYRQRPEWVVQGGIQKLEVIGENSAVRGARVALSFLVRDEDGGRVLMDRTYEETASVPGGTVASAVVAIGDATETILTRFLHDLSDVELVKAESPRRR